MFLLRLDAGTLLPETRFPGRPGNGTALFRALESRKRAADEACHAVGMTSALVSEAPVDPAMIPAIISVDDHVVEPPDLWQRWLPRALRAGGPRVVEAPYELLGAQAPYVRRAASGPVTDFWEYGSLSAAVSGGMVAVGQPAERVSHVPWRYADMRPGAYRVPERLADMSLNWVERSLCFPTFPRFCGQTFLEADDRELALACVRAYNDWMVEEWCGDSGGRLIPLCLIPLWSAELAAAEVRRNAARGVRAVAFTELPSHLGLPTLHDPGRFWDPFLRACEETATVVCMHIGSSSKLMTTSADAPMGVKMALTTINSQMSLADWLLSGVLARFTRLRLAYSESQIGWMPYLLERLDRLWKAAYPLNEIPKEITRPPSSYFRGRVYGCLLSDDFGLRSRADIGVDQITFESDYPHQDSTWPDTRQYAAKVMAGLGQDEIRKIVRGNAIELFGLPLDLAVRASAAADPGESARVAHD
jgi:predicted TIM-barrel fold metal-dependent hydrolase